MRLDPARARPSFPAQQSLYQVSSNGGRPLRAHGSSMIAQLPNKRSLFRLVLLVWRDRPQGAALGRAAAAGSSSHTGLMTCRYNGCRKLSEPIRCIVVVLECKSARWQEQPTGRSGNIARPTVQVMTADGTQAASGASLLR
jgi:hypothetical protein